MIKVSISQQTPVRVSVGNHAATSVSTSPYTVLIAREPEKYMGDYAVTPQDDPVVLETSGLLATGNIVVNPIPSNYGKITWDGFSLSVT